MRERGLKGTDEHFAVDMPKVAPVRERGLKVRLLRNFGRMVIGRSREGAWIESNI